MKCFPHTGERFVLFVLSLTCNVAAGFEKHQAGHDMYCGARCARSVLSHYGHDEDLLNVIKAVQWPQLEDPISIEQLVRFLNQRGVYTHACRIGPGMDLIGDEPAIVHLSPTDGGDGHFVVWISGSDGRANITDGLHPPWLMSARDFASSRSGALILTSASPISDPRSRFVSQRYAIFHYLPELCGVAFASAVYSCVLFLRWRIRR